MNLFARLLVIALTTAHAALGCCLHHEHTMAPDGSAACCDHHEHASHSETSHEPSEEHPSDEPCDEESCVFVVQTNEVSFDLSTLVAPLFLASPLGPAANVVALHSRAAVEDVLHPAGPALHLWQCVLVI